MGKPFWRSVEYFFTGNYSADDGNNSIVAIGFGGEIHAYGGDDHVTVGSIGATVYTGSGNDTVVGGSAYLRVEDTTGHLSVKGAAGYADINKSGDGNVSFAGAAGGVSIDHLGNHGDVSYGGAAAYNGITRKGLSGNVTFMGAGGYNALWHETNQGNLFFAGVGGGNKLDRTWFNRYQGSRGDVTFYGAGAANSISSRVETGNITFRGAGADNHLVRKGKVGDITLQGAGASNRIERTRQAEDVYAQTRGNIRFEGVGGYNSFYSDVAHGDIHFSGGGAYNTITRKGSGSSFDAEGMEYAKAEDIVLTAAQMHGLSIDNGNKFHAVTAVKSEREPNTYLFAIADGTYTKINKVRLYNDPETGKLKYYSEAWFKRGNHLAELARSDVSSAGGFEVNPINGGYTLSNIAVEHQQSVTVHAVEKDLTEYEWVTYANGTLIDAKDVALSEAKMGGHAISTDGTTVDVQAVKSNRKPNTYVYAKVLGPYTKIVVVELANDPKTGALKYQARSWYKEGDHTENLANEDISSANGYHSVGKGGYSLSDLHYSVNAVRSISETVADINEYTDQTLFKPATDSGESSGDVHFNGAGGGNVIKSNVTRGNVYFNGGGIANVILHSSQFGHTEFNGGGAANVIVKSGEEGDLTFRGAGLANVLVHQSKQGKMDVYAGGAVNVLVRIGDGQYLAHLLAYGNISVHKGNGNSRVVMLGGYNTHTQIGSGNGLWLAAGGFNVMTQVGKGDVASVLAGGANVLTKVGDGDLTAGMLGGANVITHISGDNETSNTTAVALGGANILTKKGKGNTLAVMGGGANVLTHVGDGTTTGVMVGGANILTKVGNGDTTGIMLGVGNVLTHVGDGQTLGVMGAAGNIFTKVGDGTSIAVMIGAGNIFTHVGEGNAWALMGGLGNVFTKVGNGDALALMVAEANVFTHIGDGMSVALMLAKGNVATKVGNGTTLAAMVGNANIFTHVGSGSTFAAMIGQANIMTKVGNDLTAALMVGKANIYTHVGDGTSLGIFAGEVNVMTKVGNGTTLAAMFGKANIMTHVGDGLTGVLALGEANIVTKVGDDFMGVVAAAKANVVTHVGDATTAAVLAGKGNILTKVGEGNTVGLLISDIGNVMTHVGDGTTIGIAKGKANIITKVGDGLGVNVAWGQANVFTQVGDGDRYNFAKGEANIITKVGDGQEVSVVQGKANIITHVGNGDDYTGAWGKANVITKVGNGRNVVLAKGEANIVTQVGDGDSFNALWSKGNIVTKVGDGMQVTAAKGKANITTTVGDGLSVTAAYGDANINTKVGDGVSVNVAWGKYNINTKVGDGLNVAVMKGKANANIHVGDGLNINASYAQNNVAIKVGNGDFYSLAVASSNTSSNKLSALFDNIKQTLLGVGGSQAINYLVQGDEASSSGTQKGRGAIATPEITKLDGFQMEAIEEVGSDLGDSLTGSVTKVDTPDLNKMQNALDVDGSSDQTQAPNLIVNGDFEQGDRGWKSTHGVEASYSGNVYGVNGEGHGARVTELDTYTNTSLYQDLTDLTEGEVIAVSFDFAKRAGLSNNEGIEVLWNGEVVFSSSGDASAWQQKTLKLTAHAGSNRIEFKGTGHNDGLGYILDNVVAKSESSQQANAVSEHATQNQASQNALSDKERAEADRQRLEQEKQKQLDAVAGSQSQLESTDQQALGNNGQAQRDAVKEESEAVTAELTKLAQGLDVLDGQATHTGESGDQWRNDFAGGLLDGVQSQLDDAKQLANDKIAAAKQTQSDNNSKVKESVAKSEAGVAQGEQNRAGAEQDIAEAKADAETRKADAVAKSNDAKQAESDAHSAANDAQSRGDRDAMNAENKANQAQNDAKGTKQNEGDRPDREGVAGSGLSGNAHRVEGAGETGSHVNTDSPTNADGRFSEGLSEQEQEALEGATNAVNRLQINAGIRGKNSGSTITSMFTETNSDSIVVPTTASQDVVRKEIRMSGVNLEGLSGVQGSQKTVGTGEVLKGLQEDFKRYGDALKPDTSVPGKSKDIRTTKDFLNGYKNDHAKEIVDGFRSDMSIKQLVDLFVKGNWSAEQKGALAWEIESRALKVTFQNKSEKYNRLFREIASAGVVDAKATEQLAPQLMLLNLSNDGFGGRCDPLSKLVLVAKQLENDGQVGVARQLLEKMYSAAAVLSNPTLYSDSEKANASKLLSSLAAIHAKNPMHDTSMKVWQEKLEGKQALTVNGVVEKITDASANGKPVLLELDAPGHAMAAWAKGSGDDRVYGFYDPNAGIVEFSSAEKFGDYLTRFFGKSDLNMAQSYKLGKNDAGEAIFNRVVVMDGNTLASYKPTFGDNTTMQEILDLPVFDATPINKPEVTDVLDALSGNEKHKENVAIENDGTPPRDKESLSPLTRFLNNELYGEKDARRKIGEITQTLLDYAVENGESQKVTLKGEAGRLTGYYHQGAASSEGETSATSGKVVLFLHGSGSSAEEQASEIRNHYQKQGIDMLAVNLRGYGESDGGPSEKGLYQDARTMFNYLVNDKGIDPSNIIIHGYSMGGPIAADLARYAAQNGQAVSGLLLDRPMPSMTKAITAHEVANPAGIVGAIAKAVNGQFSVEKNLKGLPKETPILLLTDNEGLGEEGEKLRAKLAIAGYNVTGEQTFYGHEASNRLMGQYADQIVSGLFNAEQAAVEAGEVLKGLEKDFKRYGDALKPDTSVPGKSKDIRTTKDFLNGYKNDHAKEIVDGFRSDMSIKQLVDLFVKGNWSAEQKGALAWEIESRALKVTFQNKSEKYNRLFREIASAGVVDAKATEQLAPQLMLLNLSNDGFGGRCDPLSKLVLVAKQLENDGQVGVARQLLEKMYSAAAVLSNPTLYSDSEKANASKLLSSLAAIHAKNPMHDTSMKVWQEKLEGKQALTVNGVVEKITDASANGKPVLLELDAPGHAMAAWAKGSGDDRVYGFYDPNAGIVEFSSAEKFGDYLTRFFGKSDLNMAQSYKLGKNDAGEAIFNRVVVMDGKTLASYKPTFGDKTTMQGILDLPVFDATPMKKPTGGVASDLEALGDKTKVVVDLAQIFTVQELKERAKVFAKPIGASYQGILDQLDLVHQAKGRDQIAASFELNKKINDYIAEHPTSGRNQALTQLKEQVTNALFIGKMQVAQAGIDAIAQTRPELAARIFMVAIEEANGKHVGLTDMMVRWANEDPYLAPKHGYKGETPSDLGFDAKYHVDLGEHYADFKQWLETSQSNGLLSKATLDESTKTVHLGYSYQELQDLTGAEPVQMAFYFLKEAAKKADPISGDSAEMILLKKYADQSYLSQLDSDRMDQIEGIYRSSHETDIDAWDRRYSGTGYDELTNKLASATGVDEQLAVLLDDRKGLLIGEVHGSDVNGLRFVNEQMDALKKQGVTVIGLEHLRSDLAQPLIDRYLATGVMSSELSAMLKTKHLDVTLFENARANGMRIVALDANSSARPNVQGTEHGLMYRAGAANNIAVEVLQNLPDGEKFVAIYGKAHLQSHKGIEGFVPGITHRLDLPALKVSDSNQFTVEQDDVSLRVVYDDVANKPKITFKDSLSGANTALHNQNVNDWERVVVTPTADGGESRFDGQIIVQMENDDVVAKAAANLAGKHPESSVVVQIDSDGNYRVVYGDPSKLDGKLRWQLVGHGRDDSESNNTRLSGYSADELAVKLAKFQQSFNQAENINNKPDHISIVGCSLVSDDKQKGFGHQFINAMDANGLRVDVSVRSSELAVDEAGRKHTKDANGDWVQKAENNKVSLSWDEQGEVVAKDERIRNGIAEGDIDLSRIGVSDVDEPARGAIGDNNDVFDAPEKRKAETETSSSSANNKLSYSGNIQVNVGDGEFTAVNWGTSNVGIKVGTGGFKSLAFGDNNVMVHIGNGESKHSFDIGGYQALEGAQMFIGNRNVSFNLGRSNDLIVMMDKSIPTPPLVNPFDGAARISGVLQSIATSGEGQDWLAAQEQQWTLSGAKKFVKDMSGLDQSSSVDYTSLVELDSQNERSSRGLKYDAEAALNKQYNQWLSGNSDSDTSKLSRADKLRQANEKLAFNFAVGGQGADIQVTTGNWNFMFGDNIQSILDTNLGSLFGLMTQQFSATGQAKTTFTYTPEDLPRQLKNKLLGQLAGVGAETTLADIFGVDYTASGQIVSRNGEAVDGVAILKEMLEVIGEFSGDQLQAFVDPAKLLDSLKAGINMGADGIKSFAETHGLKEKAPEEEEDNSSVSVNGASVNSAQGATVADGSTETAETPDRAFGFNSLNLPNLFATIFSQDKQKEMKSLVENLKENLTADLLNMKEKTFDFLRNSGHLQGDGDINISLGNYNFNWGGDGKDLGAYLGDNNNFWGGRGDDVFYATGTSNIFTGGEGNDMGVLMGRENMMFGGDGNDTAVVAGRINHVFLGAGDDQSFVFGEGGEIDTGSGRDYVVTSGNFNRVDTGDDQDYSVTIGNNNQVDLGAGNDFTNVFGNYNRINASAGNDVVKLMGYHAVLNGGEGEDHLIAAAISKFSQFNGGEGRDLMVLGGYQNTFKGGTDVDSFVVSGDIIDNLVEDIRSEDNIVFNGIDWQKLWFERSGYDLKLSILRDPASDSDQAKFEHIGSVTFSDYFNGNRAQVIITMGEKDATGEREYTTLSESAIDALVQAMSGFDPQAGDNGFIDNLDSKSRVAITTAWADVVHKKGITV
ncbi:TPA: MARTX multifunctional-autoprocessing repeats-in-toxin holotoxin RtxA [Vibrio vulnificus]|nr:MARTX multifunctional-autoprocessing repeats-in-toxin holotoxin RtxA [Vibrio vulnificus]HDY8192340.1 MARTX multifunctional-autoprocessing repeats-in-toxin holotoxin RtxA [Vibrio vulnificus]